MKITKNLLISCLFTILLTNCSKDDGFIKPKSTTTGVSEFECLGDKLGS